MASSSTTPTPRMAARRCASVVLPEPVTPQTAMRRPTSMGCFSTLASLKLLVVARWRCRSAVDVAPARVEGYAQADDTEYGKDADEYVRFPKAEGPVADYANVEYESANNTRDKPEHSRQDRKHQDDTLALFGDEIATDEPYPAGYDQYKCTDIDGAD